MEAMSHDPHTPPDPPTAAAYALVAAVIGLALFASATPSPLYGIYRARWHFSTFVLTLVYAIYPFGVLAALLPSAASPTSSGAGRCSALALGGLIVAMVLFMRCRLGRLAVRRARRCRASPPAWRWAPPSAALLDLHPRRDPAGAGLINGVVSAGGLASACSLPQCWPSSRPPRWCAVPRAPGLLLRSLSPVRWPCPSR